MQNSSYNILIVDDSQTFTKIVSEIILNNVPHTSVKAVNSGMEAIRVLGNNQIDLIMMDVFMPVFDGLEMAKIIRNNEKTSNVPIIFMTGADPEKELMSKALEIGGIDYLSKSFKEDEIVRLVNLYLRFIKWEREVNRKLDENINLLNQEIEGRKQVEKTLMEITGKLKEANLTKDKFFSIIAHDLKNPLGSFKNLAEMMLGNFDQMEDKEISEFLTVLLQSATNMYSLLENLLLWSRSQTGSIKVNFDTFNLFTIITSVYEVVVESAKNKKIELLVECEPEVNVFADVNMINTVIRNLVTNAIKFTPFAGKVIMKVENENDGYLVKIIDTGVGMSNDEVDNLFIIGAVKNKLGTNMESGTGLGLIICNEFISQNKSKLKIKSKEGVGSEFSFILEKSTA